MIVVNIELWPGGDEKKSKHLGIIAITNDGTGTKEKANYNYVLSHAGIFFGKRKEPYKKGSVRGFFRKLSPYRLLARCLKEAGEV